MFPPAESKISLYRQRLAILHQRLMRNQLFTPPALELGWDERLELTPIQTLLGGGAIRKDAVVLGVLVQVGRWVGGPQTE